jgi:hypothetical protein
MRIRVGFVSNSSSTSFCIVGIAAESNSELGKEIAKLDWKKVKASGLESHSNLYMEWLGMDICQLKDNQTLGEFKTCAMNKLKELGIEATVVSIHQESWY